MIKDLFLLKGNKLIVLAVANQYVKYIYHIIIVLSISCLSFIPPVKVKYVQLQLVETKILPQTYICIGSHIVYDITIKHRTITNSISLYM